MKLCKQLNQDPFIRKEWQKISNLPGIPLDRVANFFDRIYGVHEAVSKEIRYSIFAFRRLIEIKKFVPEDYVCEISTPEGNDLSLYFNPILDPDIVVDDRKFTLGTKLRSLNQEQIPIPLIETREIMEFHSRSLHAHQIALEQKESPVKLSVIREIMNQQGKVQKRWRCDRLARLYVEFGDQSWLSPLKGLILLDTYLPKDLGIRIIDQVLKIVCTAASMGFPPNLVLEYALLPLVQRNPQIDRKFAEGLDQILDVLRVVSGFYDYLQLGRNYQSFLLFFKYYFHPLIKSGQSCSNLVYERDQSRQALKTNILSWLKLLSREQGSECILSIAKVLTQSAFRLEVLSTCTTYFELLNELMDKIEDKAADFDFQWGHQQVTLNNLEYYYSNQSGQLLRLCLSHIKVLIILLDESDYEELLVEFLELLRKGHLRDENDFVDYLERKRLRLSLFQDRTGALPAFYADFVKNHPTVEDRKLLSYFLSHSRLLNYEFFQSWKLEEESKQLEILEMVNQAYQDCLYSTYRPSIFDEYKPLEVAVVENLLGKSRLGNRENLKESLSQLNQEKLPHVPEQLLGLQEIEVSYYQHRSMGILHRDRSIIEKFVRLHQTSLKVANVEHPQILRAVLLKFLQRSHSWDPQRGIQEQIKKLKGLLEEWNSREDIVDLSEIKELLKLEKKVQREILTANQLAHIKKIKNLSNRLSQSNTKFQIYKELCDFSSSSAVKLLNFKRRSQISNAHLFMLSLLTDDKLQIRNASTYLYSLSLNRGLGFERLEYPLRTCLRLDAEASFYELEQVEALLDHLQTYLIPLLFELFNEYLIQLKNLNRGLFMRLARFWKLNPENIEVASNQLIVRFCKKMGLPLLEKELNHMEEFLRDDTSHLKKLGLLAARSPMDQYFGNVGENCTSEYPEEIMNEDFIPIRIIDMEDHKLIGYVHLLLTTRDELNFLVIPGIEPKNYLMYQMDAKDLYIQIRSKLLYYSQQIAHLMLYPTETYALSNRVKIMQAMHKDMLGKKIFNIPKLRFPQQAYDISKQVIVWNDPSMEEFVDGLPHRYTTQLHSADLIGFD